MPDLLHFPQPTPQDDAAARATALDITLSAIVEAPAGSGKTGLLMQRYLKLLASPDVTQPEEVLAITFTNKAAAELRERVLTQLENAHRELPIPPDDTFAQQTRDFALAVLHRDTQLQWDLLARPQRLNLRTIDSVCAEIANSLPLLSGSGAPRRPTENALPLYRQAAQRTLFQLGGADATLHAALRTLLLHRDGSLFDCERLLAQMLAAREQWGELIPLDPAALTPDPLDNDVRPRLERTLEAIVCAGLSRVLALFPEAALHEATQLAAHLGSLPPYKDKQPLLAICADKRIPPAAVADHLDHWLALAHLLTTRDGGWRSGIDRGNLTHDFDLKRDKPRIQQLIADLKASPQSDPLLQALGHLRDLPPSRYPDEQWHVAKALFHVLRRSLAELRVLFAESGDCDFTELALAAREALRADASAPDIALAFGSKLRHLLVDEMQDTSSGQYELIHLLTQSWDGHHQTLFLVGDPKQSIYLFRQARVERFLRTMRDERLGDITLTPLRLTSNFRSQATLVESFNATFEQLFPTPEAAAQQSTLTDVPFVAANPQREATLPNALRWQPALLDPQNPPRIPHDLQQARDIRSIIQRWLATPLPEGRAQPWRIAILARARTHLTSIVAELKRAGIPYRAVNIDALDERPEVLDALALTRALLHPADRVAWLAILHAPWCGLALADLLTLAGAANPTTSAGPAADPDATLASLVAARAQLLTQTGQQLLARTWPILRDALATLGRTPLHVHVERTWRSLGGDAPLTPGERLNVQRFFEVLAALETQGSRIDLNALHAQLHHLYAEPGPQCSVELLTMHKAKGLEWDVVLVPSLERKGAASSSDFLTWLELDGAAGAPASVLLAPIAGRGQDSGKLNTWIRSIREARENAERKRLFYVACTRAKEELHLFAAVKLDAHGNLAAPTPGSLLKSCWPAAEPIFLDQLQHRSAPHTPLHADLTRSIAFDELANEPPILIEEETLTLTASASAPLELPPPILHRLPLSFNPLARFAAAPRLNYLPAAALPHAPTFDRPEGAFAVRSFGNVVHRYLQLLADRLASTTPDALLAELPTWQPRLLASLRGEGLAPAHAQREAARALRALTAALNDPAGRWILSPHAEAASEQSLTLTSPETSATLSLRADRTFLAAHAPLSTGDSHIWIVDFKTGELNNRPLDLFRSTELARYQPQLESYAAVRRSLPNGHLPIRLGLFYPLIPLLLDWTSTPTEVA